MGTGNSSSSSSSSPAAILARKLRGSSGGDSASNKTSRPSHASAGTYIRRAHHAGSWYESSASELDSVLSGYLSDAAAELGATGTGPSSAANAGKPRAVVAPHAGFSYSGPTAAYAYLALREALLLSSQPSSTTGAAGADSTGVTVTVVVLHPSHHVYLKGCAISGATEIETPISNLAVDDDLRSELLRTGSFSIMERQTDEAEHSGEMQYPYIAKAIRDANASSATAASSSSRDVDVRVLPIMIGALGTSHENTFGKILAPYLSRPDVFTVISSDFCHWGRRFGYSPRGSGRSPDDGRPHNDIADYIEWLDKLGMTQIELQRPGAFADYMKEYSNTICGRHPIGVWLDSITHNRESGAEQVNVSFVKYAQSSRVKNMNDSSVSYASAVARLS